MTKPKKARKTEVVKSVPSEKEPDKFDFGGLPAVNLKKNLGCG